MHRSAIKEILQRSAEEKKLCALGSAVGLLFLGLAWCARRCRCWLHRLYFYGGSPVLDAQVVTSLVRNRCWLHRCTRNGVSTVVPRSHPGMSSSALE